MNDPVYKLIEITGSSSASIEDAVQNALRRASQSVRHMRWFEIVNTRGRIEDGAVAAWQVTLKIGFALEDGDA